MFFGMSFLTITVFLSIFITIFGYFYLQKYWNDCAEDIAKNIKRNVSDSLAKLPDFEKLFNDLDNSVNDRISGEIIKNSGEYADYLGVSKEDLEKHTKDKELVGLVQTYVKQNGLAQIQNDPEKQEELKKVFSEYIKKKKDDEDDILEKIQNSDKPVPSNILNASNLNTSTVKEALKGSNNVDVNAQIDAFINNSAIPNRYQDNISTGAVPLVYLRG